jgi:hypothetical protein
VTIYTVDREDYEQFKKNKEKCDNVKEQLLYHGTKVDFVVSILNTSIEIDKNKGNKIGKGFYLSDLFEVSWRYGKNRHRIPKVGDSFSVLVCNTYYDEKLFENYQKEDLYKDELIPKNAVRFSKVGADYSVISSEKLKGYEPLMQALKVASFWEYVIEHLNACEELDEGVFFYKERFIDWLNKYIYEVTA